MAVKYPEIRVQLVGGDGNAFAILAKVKKALKDHKIADDEIENFMKEAQSGDYDHLLLTAMRWVDVH